MPWTRTYCGIVFVFLLLFSFPLQAIATATWTATAAPAIQEIGYSENTATFSSVNIGTASSGRIVVVGVGNDSSDFTPNAAVKSVTIGGISATLAATTTGNGAGIWYANVPTGTTANIVLTGGTSNFGLIGIQVGILTGVLATPSSIGLNNDNYNGGSAAPTITATVSSGGVGVILFNEEEGSPLQVPAWANATADSYVHDETGNTMQVILAHTFSAGSQTATLNSSSASTYLYQYNAGVAATWAPAPTKKTTIGHLKSTCSIGSQIAGGYCRGYLVASPGSLSSFTVPADWSGDNNIQTIRRRRQR